MYGLMAGLPFLSRASPSVADLTTTAEVIVRPLVVPGGRAKVWREFRLARLNKSNDHHRTPHEFTGVVVVLADGFEPKTPRAVSTAARGGEGQPRRSGSLEVLEGIAVQRHLSREATLLNRLLGLSGRLCTAQSRVVKPACAQKSDADEDGCEVGGRSGGRG